ncbi:hypothetical protein LEN26_014414 [Aphanomyces euteiches]|nr:hypothetical protein LEN26_014414 [Aphanomyces euteiches]KAH9111703.1 hypothetical protein AeMF1_013850 [Aphanomyces euteiches]
MTCVFTDCKLPVLPGLDRCLLHRHRRKCMVETCTNQVYARNRCVRHGGKKKCIHPGCCINVLVGDLCARHGNCLRTCSMAGCTSPAVARRRCERHGGVNRFVGHDTPPLRRSPEQVVVPNNPQSPAQQPVRHDTADTTLELPVLYEYMDEVLSEISPQEDTRTATTAPPDRSQ